MMLSHLYCFNAERDDMVLILKVLIVLPLAAINEAPCCEVLVIVLLGSKMLASSTPVSTINWLPETLSDTKRRASLWLDSIWPLLTPSLLVSQPFTRLLASASLLTKHTVVIAKTGGLLGGVSFLALTVFVVTAAQH